MSAARIQTLSRGLIRELIRRAGESPRRRTNYNFHGAMEENPHRFLNVMLRGAYVTPHRHLNPPKTESFLVLEGEVAFFVFDDAGAVMATHRLGRENVGIDIGSGIWHSLAVLTDHAVCFEVKPGPYLAANDKDFAPWAPREGDPAAPEYLERLLALAAEARP